MPGIKPFLTGMLAGGCLSCAALQYHLVRSDEGMYLVPRTPQPSLALAYADTRDWTGDQWGHNPELVAALRAGGAADLLSGDLEPTSRDELRDAMQRQLDDFGPFAEDEQVDSETVVNKPTTGTHRARDGDPVATGDQRRKKGFLDDVRSELDRSFGHQFRVNDGGRSSSTGLNDWRDDTLSDTLQEFDSSVANDTGLDDPYSGQFNGDMRHRSFEYGTDDETEDSEKYVPTPNFDEDDDILNRFTPRSGEIDAWNSSVTSHGSSWSDDPWAQASQSTNQTPDAPYHANESSSGWQPARRGSSADHTMSGVLDRFSSSTGEVARETTDRTSRGLTSSLQDRLTGFAGRAAGSIDNTLPVDADGLYSPFTEAD